MKITSVKEFFEFEAGSCGEMARWDKIVEYFYLLAEQSRKIKVVNMGETTEGNEFLQVIISSEDNIKRLDEIKKDNFLVSDPRGLSEEEMEELAKKGKAICLQSMSLHSHEIGGTQMSVELAYELITSEDEQTLNILENVVFVMVPCFNPDGQIKVTDWYYSTKGTKYEGSEAVPFLYHKYAGHDNNRDAVFCNLKESRYMNKILFHEWKPQCYQDHHHMNNNSARMFVGYPKNPINTYHSPLLMRESMQYGTHMACRLDSEGFKGIVTGAMYNECSGCSTHYDNARMHNIVGFLSESATARLASPIHIYPDYLTGEKDDVTEGYLPSMEMPRLWEGGEWSISDIVSQMLCAAKGLLDVMAKNRYEVVSNMMKKALEQTERGKNDEIKAYAVRNNQYDISALKNFLNVLKLQDIEMYVAEEDFILENKYFPKGTIVVFTAQPNYAAVRHLLGECIFPVNKFTMKNNMAKAGEYSTLNIADSMGIEVDELHISPDVKLEKFTDLPDLVEIKNSEKYMISACENDSYLLVNKLLSENKEVFRTKDGKSFYFESLPECVKDISVTVTYPDKKPADLITVKQMKIALYEVYWHGDITMGWTRLLCDRYGFKYDYLKREDVMAGKLKDYDVFVLPNQNYDGLCYGGPKPTAQMDDDLWNERPEGYRYAFGKEGVEKLSEFVKCGGRLIAFEKAYEFITQEFNIPIVNSLENVTEFNSNGSFLNIDIDTKNYLCWGMPGKIAIRHMNSPVFNITDRFNHDKYSIPVKYIESKVLKNGLLYGEKYIAGKNAIIDVKIGKGNILFYGFLPHHRMQSNAAFKLLFNALYKYEN